MVSAILIGAFHVSAKAYVGLSVAVAVQDSRVMRQLPDGEIVYEPTLVATSPKFPNCEAQSHPLNATPNPTWLSLGVIGQTPAFNLSVRAKHRREGSDDNKRRT